MRTTAPGQSALLLLDIIDILNQRKTAYAVIGAFAVSFYGSVRASLDVDAVISIHTREELTGLSRDLKHAGWVVEQRRGDQDDPIAGVTYIQDQFGNRVDLLLGIRGMDKKIFDRVKEARFMNSKIKMVSQEDLIAMKIFAGSPKDLQDVIGIFQVSGTAIDLILLKKLTSQYGSSSTKKLQELLKEYPLEK